MMEPVSQERVRLTDPFWAPRQRALVERTIPHLFEQLEQAGNAENFRLAAAGKREGFQGPVYMDSDLYKALEAAALALHLDDAAPWRVQLEALVELVASAQTEDGYINTWFTINAPNKRYTNLRDAHELYCMGHLIEAALAHRDAVGESMFMEVAHRVVAHLVEEFLTRKRPGYPGHPELELALIRYFEATGEAAALDLAREFITRRGSHFFAQEHGTPEQEYDGTYWLDRVPVRELETLEGHAVRGLYLMCAVTDLARLDGDRELREVVERVWKHTTERRMYVTGGFGSSEKNEGFTRDYDLPNRYAYQETCASIAFVFWCERMIRLTGETKYMDALESALYNAVAAGASLDGTLFFYDNPLEDDGSRRRQPWFRCACCPPNYARLVAQVSRYVWARDQAGLVLQIPMASRAHFPIERGTLHINLKSGYPWNGAVTLAFTGETSSEISLTIRLPHWAESMKVSLDGESTVSKNRAAVYRQWRAGDEVRIEIPFPITPVFAHPEVAPCRGKFCIVRGPVVYCLEGNTNDLRFSSLFASPDALIEEGEPESTLDPIAPTLIVQGRLPQSDELYTPFQKTGPAELRLIPYALWANREARPMRVWIPTTPSPLEKNESGSNHLSAGNV